MDGPWWKRFSQLVFFVFCFAVVAIQTVDALGCYPYSNPPTCSNSDDSISKWYYVGAPTVKVPTCQLKKGVCLDDGNGFDSQLACMIGCAHVTATSPCDILRCPIGSVCKASTRWTRSDSADSSGTCIEYNKPCLFPQKDESACAADELQDLVAKEVPELCPILKSLPTTGALGGITDEQTSKAKAVLCPSPPSGDDTSGDICDVCKASSCLEPFHDIISKAKGDGTTKDSRKDEKPKEQKSLTSAENQKGGICSKYFTSKQCIHRKLGDCDLSQLREHVNKVSHNVEAYCHRDLVLSLIKFEKISADILSYKDDDEDQCEEEDPEEPKKKRCTCDRHGEEGDIGECPKKDESEKKGSSESSKSSKSGESKGEKKEKSGENNGNSKEKKGNSKEKKGNSKEKKGNSKENKGNSKEKKGNSKEKKGNSKEKKGNSKENNGNSKENNGNSKENNGNSKANNGNSKENNGKSGGSNSKEDKDNREDDRSKRFCKLCKELPIAVETVNSNLFSIEDTTERGNINDSVSKVLKLVSHKCQFVSEVEIDVCKMARAASCGIASLFDKDAEGNDQKSTLVKAVEIFHSSTGLCKDSAGNSTDCPQTDFDEQCKKQAKCPGMIPALRCIHKFHKELMVSRNDSVICRSQFDTKMCVKEMMTDCENEEIKSYVEKEFHKVVDNEKAVCKEQSSLLESVSEFKMAVSELFKAAPPKEDKCNEDKNDLGTTDKKEGSGSKGSSERDKGSSEQDKGSKEQDKKKGSGKEGSSDQDKGSGEQDEKKGSGKKGSGEQDKKKGSGEKDKKKGSGEQDKKKGSGEQDKKKGSGEQDKNKGSGEKNKKKGEGSDESENESDDKKKELEKKCGKNLDIHEKRGKTKIMLLCADVQYQLMRISNHIDTSKIEHIMVNTTVHNIWEAIAFVCKKGPQKSCNPIQSVGCALSLITDILDEKDLKWRDVKLNLECMEGTKCCKFEGLSRTGRRRNIIKCLSKPSDLEQSCVTEGRKCVMRFKNKFLLSRPETLCKSAKSTKQCIEDAFKNCNSPKVNDVWNSFRQFPKKLPCCDLKMDEPEETLKESVENTKKKALAVFEDPNKCAAATEAAESLPSHIELLSGVKRVVIDFSFDFVKVALESMCDDETDVELTTCSLDSAMETVYKIVSPFLSDEDIDCSLLEQKLTDILTAVENCDTDDDIKSKIEEAVESFNSSEAIQNACYKPKRCGMPGARYFKALLSWPDLSPSVVCKQQSLSQAGITDASTLNKCDENDQAPMETVMNSSRRVIGKTCPKCETCSDPENACEVAEKAPSCFDSLKDVTPESDICTSLEKAQTCLITNFTNCQAFETVIWKIHFEQKKSTFDTSSCYLKDKFPSDDGVSACYLSFAKAASYDLQRASTDICSKLVDFKECLKKLELPSVQCLMDDLSNYHQLIKCSEEPPKDDSALKCIACKTQGMNNKIEDCNKEEDCKMNDPVCQTVEFTKNDGSILYQKGCKQRDACKSDHLRNANHNVSCCSTDLCNNQPEDSTTNTNVDLSNESADCKFEEAAIVTSKLLLESLSYHYTTHSGNTEFCKSLHDATFNVSKSVEECSDSTKNYYTEIITSVQKKAANLKCAPKWKYVSASCSVESAKECLADIPKYIASSGIENEELCLIFERAVGCFNVYNVDCTDIEKKKDLQKSLEDVAYMVGSRCFKQVNKIFCTATSKNDVSPSEVGSDSKCNSEEAMKIATELVEEKFPKIFSNPSPPCSALRNVLRKVIPKLTGCDDTVRTQVKDKLKAVFDTVGDCCELSLDEIPGSGSEENVCTSPLSQLCNLKEAAACVEDVRNLKDDKCDEKLDCVKENVVGCMPLWSDILLNNFVQAAPSKCEFEKPETSALANGINECMAAFKKEMINVVTTSTTAGDMSQTVSALKSCLEGKFALASGFQKAIFEKLPGTMDKVMKMYSEVEKRDFVTLEDKTDCDVEKAVGCMYPYVYDLMFFGPFGFIQKKPDFISRTLDERITCIKDAASGCTTSKKYMLNLRQKFYNAFIADYFDAPELRVCAPQIMQTSLLEFGAVVAQHDVEQDNVKICRGLSQMQYDFNRFTDSCEDSIKKDLSCQFEKLKAIGKPFCEKFAEMEEPEKPKAREPIFSLDESPEEDEEDKKCLRQPRNEEYTCEPKKAQNCSEELETTFKALITDITATNSVIKEKITCIVKYLEGCALDETLNINNGLDDMKSSVKGTELKFFVPKVCKKCLPSDVMDCVTQFDDSQSEDSCSAIDDAKSCIDQYDDRCDEDIIQEAKEDLDKNIKMNLGSSCENRDLRDKVKDFDGLLSKILLEADMSVCDDLEEYYQNSIAILEQLDTFNPAVVSLARHSQAFLKKWAEEICKERTFKCKACSKHGNDFYNILECDKEVECNKDKEVCQTIIKTHKDDPLEYSKGCKNKKACKHGRKSKNKKEYCCSTYLCNNEPYEVSEDKLTGDRSGVFSLMTGLYAKIIKNKDPSTELCREIKTLKPYLYGLLDEYGRREKKLIFDAFTKLQDEVTGSSCKQPESTCKLEDTGECRELLAVEGATDDEKCRSILAARSCLNEALSGCEIVDKTTQERLFDEAVEPLQEECPTFPEVEFCNSVNSFFMSPGSSPESICLYLTSELEKGSEFRIRLQVEPKSEESPSVLIEGGCDLILTEDNWTDKQEIKFQSKIDGKRHGTKTDTVKVYGDYYKTASSDPQTVLLDKFVIVTEYGKQKKARCSSINDPHLTTFDKTKYENFNNGEFIMTKNKDQDYEVHAVYSKCSSANCNCACLIRVEKTIISFDRCPRKGRKGKKNRRLDVRIWMDETGELPKGLDIKKSKSGNKYTVQLPGGTQVKVASRNAKKLKGSERRFINIRILASPVDYLSSEGLCGSYSGRKNQDFLMPDGTVYKPSTRKQKKYPNEFSRAWRVDMKKGLINGNIYVDKTGEIEQKVESQFCTCVSGKTEPEACRTSVAITDVENTEEVITSTLETLSSTVVKEVAFGIRKKRQTSSTVDDLDIDVNEEPVDPEWPTPSGWTLETATNYCTEQLANDSAVSNCLKLGQSIEEEIDHCVADIQTSDGTEWASEAKDNIIENCLEAINQDPDLANNPDTKTIVDEIKALSCPDDCNSPQGTCTVEGICVCKDGYTSEDCSLSTSAVPVIDDVGSSGHCKKNSPGDCKTVAVQGENFMKSDKLTCHLEEITYTESGTLIKSGKVTQVKAVYERVDSIQCHLPFAQSTSIPVSATVTVSNDGVRTSGSMQYIAYDEECYSCTNNECKRQPNTCVIDNICYVDRETKPNQPCLYCDSSKENEWTVLNEYKCESFNNYGKEEFDIATRMGIGIGVVAFIILVIVIVLIYRRQSKSLKPKDRESIMESSSSDGYPSPLVFSNTTYNGSMNVTGDKVHKLALTPDGEKGWAHATSTPPAYMSGPEYSRIHRNVNFHDSVKDGIPVRINSKEYQQTF